MECNYLPISETTCKCLPTKESSFYGDNSSHGAVVKVLVFVVIFLSVAVAHLMIQVHYLNNALLQNQYEQANAVQVQELCKMLEQNAQIPHIKSHLEREKRNGGFRNRVRQELIEIRQQINTISNTTIPNLQAGIMKKVVQLEMSKNMTQDILHDPVNSIDICLNGNKCLRWSNPESTYSRTFDYLKDNAYDMTVAIKIRSGGIYSLGAQIAINGYQQGPEPSVGFEAVLFRNSNGHPPIIKTLRRSFITQDNRGGAYDSYGRPSNPPFDTLSLSGTFKFLCEDYIVIRVIGNPTLVFYNTEASYFSITQINPADSLLRGDQSCSS